LTIFTHILATIGILRIQTEHIYLRIRHS